MVGAYLAHRRQRHAGPMRYRYWRINISAQVNPGAQAILNEIQMRSTVGGADLTAPGGGSMWAYSNSNGSDPHRVVDNDVAGLAWFGPTSPRNPAILGYDFGSPVAIVEIGLYLSPSSGTNANSPNSFTLEYSSNGANWTVSKSWASTGGLSPGTWRYFS